MAGYVLEEQVGAGGMAVVFRAVDERLDRQVALKVLAPALASDEEFRRRFIRESRAAAAVDDPHIVPVYEAGEADGVLFIAMRYVAGGDVHALLRRQGPLPPDRVAAIISPVASALDAAHAAGLVHRDVKPTNMLLDARPERPDHVYLSDFGLSKGMLSSATLTGLGLFLGTPDYVAPEQIEGKPVTGQADQYALACAAFEILTGQAPFRRDEARAVIWSHLSVPPPSVTSVRPGLPAEADQVFARAMAKNPADRYPRCADFAEALRGALGLAPYAYRVIPVPDPPAATPAEQTQTVAAWPPQAAQTMPPRPPSDHRLTGPGAGPAAKRRPLAAGVAIVAIAQLLPADIPASSCVPSNPGDYKFAIPGAKQVLDCQSGNWQVTAFQMDSPADYATTWQNFNHWIGHQPSSAGSTCPPQGSSGQGTVPWSNKYFSQHSGQSLECGTYYSGSTPYPAYAWSFPTEDAFMWALGNAGTSWSQLDTWWKANETQATAPSPPAS